MKQSASSNDRHQGCRLFVSPTGLSGFALGVEGERAGWLYDFFVSPREDPKSSRSLIDLAVKQGARHLVAYGHPLVATFFSEFGFEVRVTATIDELVDPPAAWLPQAGATATLPSFSCMVRTEDGAGRTGLSRGMDGHVDGMVDSTTDPCFACGATVSRSIRWLGVLQGYVCPTCSIVRIAGTLTLAPWARPRPRSAWSWLRPGKVRRGTYRSEIDLLGV